MSTKVFKDFSFEAAHWLPNVPDGHKCGRLHGHSYRVRVNLVGTPNERDGWFIDFGDLKKEVKPTIDLLDHYCLNDLEGLENPTAENLARWIFNRLEKSIESLQSVEVMETCTCGVVYPYG